MCLCVHGPDNDISLNGNSSLQFTALCFKAAELGAREEAERPNGQRHEVGAGGQGACAAETAG